MNGDNHDSDVAVVHRLNVSQLGADPVDWLRQLERPTWIDIPGQDTGRCRVITTLLHGNEPSGLVALHRWLSEQQTPAVNMSFLVASVEAALSPPLFSYRMLPGQADLNRCFNKPFDGKQGRLAKSIIDRIKQLEPECVVDIHNTSGTGPSFAVSIAGEFGHCALARYFCRRMIVTDIRLSSLMEVNTGCPTVTIECGGAKDSESEFTAYNGITQIASADNLYTPGVDRGMEILHHPIRVELNPRSSIAYSDTVQEDVDVTLWSDIEHRNHGITDRQSRLGWVGPGGLKHLSACNTAGEDQLHTLLREENGWLYPAGDLQLFMATTSATIARDDCLFYAVTVS